MQFPGRRWELARPRCVAWPDASASCSRANSCAAASTRSPAGLRFAWPTTARTRSEIRQARRGGLEAQRLCRRIVARRVGPALRCGRTRLPRHRRRWAGPQQPQPAVRSRRRWSIQGPAPTIRRRGSARSARKGCAQTCSARVGLIDPLALADGAASGRPTALKRACIAGCAGTLRPIVGRPAVTSEAMPASSRSGTTSVSGPGQCSLASSARLVEHADPFGRLEARHMDDQVG